MLELDAARARSVAPTLLAAFQTTGVFGTQAMPEDLAPPGVAAGSEEHLRFITLTVALDYMRDADQLGEAGRRTYADPETRYLFDPVRVSETGLVKLVRDMQRFGLSRKPNQDAHTWQQVCTTLAVHFEGRVGLLLQEAGFDALRLLALIRRSWSAGGFPFLKGPKISLLWVRMLHDNCGVELHRIGLVPLPVDVHTAQATLQIGCVRSGGWQGPMSELREAVQAVWREACSDQVGEAYPLRMDKPLWLLSRQGCRKTTTWPCEFLSRCPVAEYCQSQHVWLTVTGNVNQDGSESKVTLR